VTEEMFGNNAQGNWAHPSMRPFVPQPPPPPSAWNTGGGGGAGAPLAGFGAIPPPPPALLAAAAAAGNPAELRQDPAPRRAWYASSQLWLMLLAVVTLAALAYIYVQLRRNHAKTEEVARRNSDLLTHADLPSLELNTRAAKRIKQEVVALTDEHKDRIGKAGEEVRLMREEVARLRAAAQAAEATAAQAVAAATSHSRAAPAAATPAGPPPQPNRRAAEAGGQTHAGNYSALPHRAPSYPPPQQQANLLAAHDPFAYDGSRPAQPLPLPPASGAGALAVAPRWTTTAGAVGDRPSEQHRRQEAPPGLPVYRRPPAHPEEDDRRRVPAPAGAPPSPPSPPPRHARELPSEAVHRREAVLQPSRPASYPVRSTLPMSDTAPVSAPEQARRVKQPDGGVSPPRSRPPAPAAAATTPSPPRRRPQSAPRNTRNERDKSPDGDAPPPPRQQDAISESLARGAAAKARSTSQASHGRLADDVLSKSLDRRDPEIISN